MRGSRRERGREDEGGRAPLSLLAILVPLSQPAPPPIYPSSHRLAALAAVPAAHLAFQYAGVTLDESGPPPLHSGDDDPLLAFEAAPSPARRAAVAAAELERLTGGGHAAASATPLASAAARAHEESPLFGCEPLAPELAAAVCAGLTGSTAPVAASAASVLVRQGPAGPALAAAVAVNVPGVLEGVCAALAGLLGDGARAAADAAATALLSVARASPAAAGAACAAALACGHQPRGADLALEAALAHPGAAAACVRLAATGAPPARAALASALTAPPSSQAVAAFTAAWAAALAGRAGRSWSPLDTADLRATAILLGAGAGAAREVGCAWAARVAGAREGEPSGGGTSITDPAARLAAAAAALLLAPVMDAADMSSLMGAVVADAEPASASASAAGVWVASHLLARRWGALAAGLRAGLGGGVTVRFPDAALDAAAGAVVASLTTHGRGAAGGRPDWAGAAGAIAARAAALPPRPGLASTSPPGDAFALEAVDAALSAAGRLSPDTLAALGSAAGAHLAAAGLPLHPSAAALAFTAASVAAGAAAARGGGPATTPDLLPPATLDACLSEAALAAAEEGGTSACFILDTTTVGPAAPALASLYLLERAGLGPPAGVWPPPLEAALPLRRLAVLVSDRARGLASIRARWLALAADTAPAAVTAALGDEGAGGGGGGEGEGGAAGGDPAFEASALAAAGATPTCPASAALALRVARRSGSAGRATPAEADAAAAAALPHFLTAAAPPAAADELARWLLALAPDAARRACARVLLALGCGGGEVAPTATRKRSAAAAGLDGEEADAEAEASPAAVAAFAADLVAAPLLALAPRPSVWESPPLARAVLTAALRTLEDARRAARALSAAASAGAPASAPPPPPPLPPPLLRPAAWARPARPADTLTPAPARPRSYRAGGSWRPP